MDKKAQIYNVVTLGLVAGFIVNLALRDWVLPVNSPDWGKFIGQSAGFLIFPLLATWVSNNKNMPYFVMVVVAALLIFNDNHQSPARKTALTMSEIANMSKQEALRAISQLGQRKFMDSALNGYNNKFKGRSSIKHDDLTYEYPAIILDDREIIYRFMLVKHKLYQLDNSKLLTLKRMGELVLMEKRTQTVNLLCSWNFANAMMETGVVFSSVYQFDDGELIGTFSVKNSDCN